MDMKLVEGGKDLVTTELPKGISQIVELPNAQLKGQWDAIFIEDAEKKKLLSQALLNFTLRKKIDRNVIPLHGIILLTGAPGTGKTTLARGLASRLADSFSGAKFLFIEIDPHALGSSSMGKTQKAVTDLFSNTICEISAGKPTIILLDEVETLAVDRSKLSMDANPIDIHRATDAVLVQLDMLAERNKNLLFVATSNFPKAIDSAFLSRCDMVMEIALPNEKACCEILKSCIEGLSQAFPGIRKNISDSEITKIARRCVGIDGRTIRKVIVNSMALDIEVAVDPNKLTSSHIENAVDLTKARMDTV